MTTYCGKEIAVEIEVFADGRCSVTWLDGEDHPDASVFIAAAMSHFAEVGQHAAEYSIEVGPVLH